MSEMNPKQAQFVREYLIDLNATQAAIRAGYSAKTAYSQGERLLKHVEVAKAIADAKEERAVRTDISADMVLRELLKIATADMADVTDWGVKEIAIGFDESGKKLRQEDIGDATVVQYVDAPFVTPINRDDLPADVRSAVAEVKLTREGFSIKMHDKIGALTLIGRHLAMWTDKVEVSADEATAKLLAEARKRLET